MTRFQVEAPLPTTLSRYGFTTLCDALASSAKLAGERGIVHVSPTDTSEDFQSYAELHAHANGVAGLLRQRGWRVGQPLILVVTSSRLFVTSFWGCMLAGVIPVPLAPLTVVSAESMEAEKIRNVAKEIQAPILFDSKGDRHIALMEVLAREAGADLVFADELVRDGVTGHVSPAEPLEIQEDSVCVLQFSSGSSGLPKGVQLTHRNLIANIEAQLDFTRATDTDVLCTWLPYFHDFGLFWGHLSALYCRIRQIHIDPSHFARRPLLWLDKIVQHRATLTNTTPTALAHLINHVELKQREGPLGQYDLSCLRALLIGAEMIEPRVCRRFLELLSPFGVRKDIFITGYGLTETTVVASAVPAGSSFRTRCIHRGRLVSEGAVVDVLPDDPHMAEFVSVGPAVRHCAIRIVAEHGEVLPPSRIGIIEISGDNVTPGYYRNLDATRACFRGAWFSSGDMGFLDQDGYLYITGRAKEMIIVNGQNYYPWDLEQIAWNATSRTHQTLKFLTICGFWDPAAAREQVVLFFVPDRVPEEQLAAVSSTHRAPRERGRWIST